MKALRIALALALVAGALTATSAFAHGRGHYRSGVSLGFHFGAPLYSYPYYYYPAPVYYPSPVVIQSPPQVYTERGDAPAAAPEAQQYWHYCAASRGYYPYVKECPGGWERVPAAPSR